MLELVIKNLIGKAKLASFCTSIQAEIGNLDLIVDGVGKVKCPIMPKTAKSLIAVAKPASFGRKDKTVYDPSVRHVWEIAANCVHIANPDWNQKLDGVLHQVCKDLNMPKGSRLSAHLHNLLVYERGQFFAPHQDSEKFDDMIATLVVLLPSNFSGGSLKIDQHGDKRTFDAGVETRSNITFITFYADCYHEVTKVTAGYRVALTYNLVLENRPKNLPKTENTVLTQSIKDYFEASRAKVPVYRQDRPRWLVYLFDHQYTQKSFGWNALKSTDREAAAQFLAAAKDLELVPHLALADIHEVWSAIEDDRDYRYGRRYWDSDEDEDESPDDGDNIEVQDLIDHEVSLNHWLDEEGNPVKFEPRSVSDEMVCWTSANDEFEPLKTEYEGYMGNYGNTVDKWYHRAAIILWPKNSDIVSRFEIDPHGVLKNIAKLLVEDLPGGRASLKKILPQLLKRDLRDDKECGFLFKIACNVGDEHLARDLLQNVRLDFITKKTLPGIVSLVDSYGEQWFIERLKSWSKKDHRSEPLIRDLDVLVNKLALPVKLTSWLLVYQRNRIIESDRSRENLGRKYIESTQTEHLKDIENLLRASAAHLPDVTAVVDHILEHPNAYPPLMLAELIHSLEDVAIPDGCRDKLLSATKDRLSEIVVVTRNDNDWSIKEILPCKCKDCKYLTNFLVNTKEQTHVWPLAKDRRQHIHGIIDGMGLPVTHVTLRQGSPQKLVLKKTMELFTRERTEKQAAVKALKGLDTLEHRK